MTDVYERLAKKLNELPSGYPATEDGVELKLLKKIFSPEDAEMALKLRPMPETAQAIAERLGKPVDEMKKALDKMAGNGQIAYSKMSGQETYMLLPFVVGIYELRLNHTDKEAATLFEDYLPHLVPMLGGHEPPLARVVPVSTEIGQDLHVHRYEDIRRMIEEAKSFQVTDCICRKEKKLLGAGCNHTLEACLFFSKEENAFDKHLRGRVISKEDALKVITDAEEEGLIHCSYNLEKGQFFICNCCSCACAILRGVKEFNLPRMLAKSSFIAEIDQDSCSACGVCAEERCQMDAIASENDTYSVLPDRCIGCGVCVSTCPTESIKLLRTPESEHEKPPANMMDWSFQRAAERGIEITLD